MSEPVETPRGTRVTPEDTGSDTYRVQSTNREAMQQELIQLGKWLAEHPEAAAKNLKPIRSAKALEPGVYYNRGTGMLDRAYGLQQVRVGHQLFRISTDPAAPVEEIRRRVKAGS